MTYCTQQDLIDRFGQKELVQLTDRTNVPPTTIDADVVTQALEDADAFIDSYIGKRYTLPLAIVPPVLSKIGADIARYNLHADRADKDHPITMVYKTAEAWLKDVARGLVQLDDGAGEKPAQSGGGQIKVTAPDRIFSRKSMKGL